MSAKMKQLLVDVHTHIYLPRYAEVLRSRSNVPRIFRRPTVQGGTEERLLILDNEPSGGRPVGSQYWDRQEKLNFMDKHGIDVSIVSSANPWIDFLSPEEAALLATDLNNDLEAYCALGPSLKVDPTRQRLYGFGLLPLVPGIESSVLLKTVKQVAELPHLRGVIMGTVGIGRGLDDEALEPVWSAIADTGLVIFLHPHYGVDGKAFGEKNNGHVLPLALGFPFETTIAVTRLILSGVFDRHPTLRLLLAHSGGALAQLSSRLASCIAHDPVVADRLEHDARYYLGKIYYDAVAYGPEELSFVSEVISRSKGYASLKASAKDSAGHVNRTTGSKRMLFGTDHPFFPPLNETDKWKSVMENLEAIDGVHGWTEEDKEGVRGLNALELFDL
ncbi:amidohydrolase 2 [Pyrrhoderma noxium]|uniref:Amidohydrolase 2 n=1 Tax=Pyrrhoderma noxium TaxID=2282107 RepID=A0A286ULZ8_9AGAM|nr:amidohydrolase 2 [Pyrrhoderma noxium]